MPEKWKNKRSNVRSM